MSGHCQLPPAADTFVWQLAGRGLAQDLVQDRVTPGQLVILNSEDLTADPDCTHSRHESFRRESKGRQHHLHPAFQPRDIHPLTGRVISAGD